MNINIYVELQKIQHKSLSQKKLNLCSVWIFSKNNINSLKPTYMGTPSLLFEEDSIKIKRD